MEEYNRPEAPGSSHDHGNCELCDEIWTRLELAEKSLLEAEKSSYRIGYVDGATGHSPQVELTEPEKIMVSQARKR